MNSTDFPSGRNSGQRCDPSAGPSGVVSGCGSPPDADTFINPGEVDEIRSGCESGALGCVDCKLKCSDKINDFLVPIIEKRNYYEKNLDEVKDVLQDGEKRGKAVAEQTMNEVHKAMKFG